MSAISIKLLNKKPTLTWQLPCLWGQITIKDFKERFEIPLICWTIDDYKRQWKEGLKRIKDHNTSCLVTYVQDPEKAPFIKWWLLYKINNKIIIRNQMLFAHLYRNRIGSKQFTPDTCYDFILTFIKKKNISQWIIDLDNN